LNGFIIFLRHGKWKSNKTRGGVIIKINPVIKIRTVILNKLKKSHNWDGRVSGRPVMFFYFIIEYVFLLNKLKSMFNFNRIQRDKISIGR